MTEYTYEISIGPQYRDVDPQGHVNQAVYLSWLEQARTRYWADVVGVRHDRSPLVVARQEIEYSAEVTLDDAVTVAQRVAGLGDSSIDLRYEVRTAGETAATASVVLVTIDRETGRSIPIPAEWRESIARFEDLD